jgi:ABC-2 type transport system permease protein
MSVTTGLSSSLKSMGRRSALAEARSLAAVIHKEWLNFIRYPSWIIALFVWPVIFPAAYILGARALAGPQGSGLQVFLKMAGTSDYMGYIVVGTTIWMWQNIVLWNVGLALRNEQLRGTLESNWLTPTGRFSYLLGSGITQFFVMLVFLTISVLEFGLVFGVRLHGDPWLVLLVFLAGIPSIYGLGFTFASLVITAKEANAFVYLVRGAVMIFCGITYPISLLPGWMRGVADWLPQTYIIHGMRTAILTEASFASLQSDLLHLLVFGLIWLAIGYTLFNWMERRARQTGAIGQY